MRLVIQRVTQAKVSTEAKGVLGEIGKGLCVLIGITGQFVSSSVLSFASTKLHLSITECHHVTDLHLLCIMYICRNRWG